MMQLLKKRFSELETRAAQVEATRTVNHGQYTGRTESVDREVFLAWCVNTKNLLSLACGPESDHFRAFIKAENYQSIMSGNLSSFQQTRAVFRAAREDFEGGYLTSVRNLVQAELFDNELEQAKELLGAGYYIAAAVIAGVVLETSLRQLCLAKQIPIGKLDKMNADLAKAGQYNSLVQKQVTSLAAVRNSAAHGDIAAFQKEVVKSMIEDIKRLVGSWLLPVEVR